VRARLPSSTTVAAAACCAALAGCVRAPDESVCPPAGAGDLVITELRGEQADGDTWLQWVEVYNGTGVELDLEGTELELVRVDGSDRYRVLVRRSLPLAPGGYAVIAEGSDAGRPAHVDYGAGGDLDQDRNGAGDPFPVSGFVSVSACGVEVDRVVFDALPDDGTWSLGATPPSASANDDAGAWCVDATASDDPTQLGRPGSPGAENRPCATP
jgi:hypothetical protein